MTQLPWYVARAAGLVAWCLLTLSVLWGLTMTTAIAKGRVKRPWLLDLHRFLGGLAVIFTGVHIGSLLVDTYTRFSLTSVLVPFASSWRPSAVAWGVVAFYLLLAVELTSLVRDRLSRRIWRAVHFASFPLFFVATIHMLTAGTDTRNPIVLGAVALAIGAVSVLTAVRAMYDSRPTRPARSTPSTRRAVPAG
jgi:predicted ferric reductase